MLLAASVASQHVDVRGQTAMVAQPCELMQAPIGLWKAPDLDVFRPEPLAKKLIRHFDAYLMNQAAFDTPLQKLKNVGQWLAPEFVYQTVGFPSSHSLAGWCVSGEESGFRTAFPTSGFSQMLFFGDHMHATTTSYGNVLWEGDLFGIPAPKNWTYFRVTDFYLARPTMLNDTHAEREGLIKWNFMMIDWADVLRRVGRPVLPPAVLPEGLFLSSSANDGVPAPLSVVAAQRDSAAAKVVAAGALEDCWVGDAPAEKWWNADMTFYGPGGIGLAKNISEFQEHVLNPYKSAFTDRKLDAKMVFCEGNYCGSYGHLTGRHVGTWVGQLASNLTLSVRYAMHWRVVDDKVHEGWAIFDFEGMFRQLGKDFWAAARNSSAKTHGSQ
jgi:predicted ester cyclase